MLQTFTFRAVDGVRQVNAKGTFFRYEAGQAGGADTSIRVTADGYELGTYQPGDGIELPTPASTWTITATSAGCVGTVRIGTARVQSARLVGDVNVIDNERAKTLGGQAFQGSGTVLGGGTGVPRVSLWNPGTSTVMLVINSMTIAAHIDTTHVVYTHGQQPPNLQSMGQSNDTSGPAAVAGVRWDNTTTAYTNVRVIRSGYLPASQDIEVVFRRPIVVRPSRGIAVYADALAANLRVSWDYEEWPI